MKSAIACVIVISVGALLAAQAPEATKVVNSIEERGRLKATREIVRKLLTKKFGELPQVALERINTLPVERLDEIALSLMDAVSLKELGLTDE